MATIASLTKASANPKLAVEKIYQKKTQLEHILLRPDTYVGSMERVESEMWIWDFTTEKMIKKEIKYVPGLFKIFDEIIVNAADNKIRDPNMTIVKVNIDKEQNMIKVYNNGKGIPVCEHKDEKMFVPTLIFGHLLTSSNYDDDEKKVTGGRNGYGAKLCNIFSKKFIVETSCKETKKYFKQTWTNNMSKTQDPVIKPNKDEDFTSITFYPDLEKFGMNSLEDDTISLLARRAYDIAASTRGVKVYLNDKRLQITKFEDYCKLYVANNKNEDDILNSSSNASNTKILHEIVNPRWEVAISHSDIGFQQVSFVNSIATTKGGRHVDHVCDQIVKYLTEVINKKSGKNSTQIKPFQIKNHIWLFINCLIENPVFESQTKESMSLQVKNFGSKCQLSDEYLRKIASKSGIVDRVLNWIAFKDAATLEKTGGKKQNKIKGLPKLDDANNAGTKDSINCTLILTEGDSAKTLAVAGLGVIGRDRYGVFPLRGKMLNVREATTKQILDNSEITSICKIIGLNFKDKYESRDSLKQLRYGKIMIMTDQDHDGSHIKGLIINFIHYHWPNLLKYGFIEEFITPIIKVSKSKKNLTADSEAENEKSFYSVPEFLEWQDKTKDWHTWKIKYYKGLGTSTSKEAKEYFSNMTRNCIKFEYLNVCDDLAIQLAFSKKLIEERKEWLTKYMESRTQRSEYLYQKDTKKINFNQFINKELILFSNLDNERSIPSLIDGFKPGQRKVIFACFKRNLTKEIKVAQLAGSVAELSAYHHGEASLMSTIINLAQNFVGSNNLNLLLPIGQFGTRLHGGKDAASPRYIFTALNNLTRLIFNQNDDPLLDYSNDDGQRVEPEYYAPIIPMVLVNGAEGIGTGWSSRVFNYDIRLIIENLLRLIKKEELKPMNPYYKNFRGTIDRIDDSRYLISGEIALIEDENDSKNDYTLEITELPVGTWTQNYKETVLEAYLNGETKSNNETASNDKSNKTSVPSGPQINEYKEYHTDCTVRFVVKMSSKQYQTAIEQGGLHKFFKLQKTISLNNMVLFDAKGVLKRYESPLEIIKEFYEVRLKYYEKRKQYLENMLGSESAKLDNLARFIMEKIEGKIKVENLRKADLIKLLIEKGYESDPVRRWKEKVEKERGYLPDEIASKTNNEQDEAEEEKDDFNYLLSMPLWNLTLEKKEEILKQQLEKKKILRNLKEKSLEQLWIDDLNEFKAELEKFEIKEKEDLESSGKKNQTKQKSATGFNVNAFLKRNSLPNTKHEYLPSPTGERIEPKVDSQLIAKIEKEAQQKVIVKAKKEESSKNLSLVDIITEKSISEEHLKLAKEFAFNLANPNKTKVKPVQAEKKEKNGDNSADHENGNGNSNGNGHTEIKKIETPKKEPKTPKKIKKEKLTMDSDSEKSFEDDSNLDLDSFQERRKTSRAIKSISYNLIDKSDSDDEDVDDEYNFENETPMKKLKQEDSEPKPKKKAESKKKIDSDFGSNDGLSEIDNNDDDDDDASLSESEKNKKKSTKPKPAFKKKPEPKKKTEQKNIANYSESNHSIISENNDGSDFEMKSKKKTEKAAPKKKQENKKITEEKKKPVAKSKKVNYDEFDYKSSDSLPEKSEDDDDDDDGSDFGASKKKKKQLNKTKPTKKAPKTAKYTASKDLNKRKSAEFIDSASNSSDEEKKPKSVKKKIKKSAANDDSDFSID